MDVAPPSGTRLSTSNGSIELTLGSAPKADIRAETSNNGITLHLPGSAAAHLIADTSNGSISSDFPVASRSGDDHPKRHLDGIIGGDGPTIQLTTRNAAIHILKGAGI